MNSGSCTDGVDGFTCACVGQFGGPTCEVDLDDCDPDPCANGASCDDTSGAAVCDCVAGWTGDTCEIDVDECAAEPCANGTCDDGADGANAFTCACDAGYEGTLCDVNPDDCAVNLCVNGTCVDGLDSYGCSCAPGYDGMLCDNDIDDCVGNLCENGAACVDDVGGYSCTCTTGFIGELCAVNPDDCLFDDCENGATCVDGLDAYTCACTTGYEGTLCDINPDDCADNACVNGSCVDGLATYTCDCATGYEGPLCDVNPDDCADNACANGSACVDGLDAYSCTCAPGTDGSLCENILSRDCEDIFANGLGTTNGLYTIDPDGAGTIAPFQVYCDMVTAGGPWTQIIDQDTSVSGGYLAAATWLAGVTTTAPNAGQWSVLQHLGAFGTAAGYRFRLTYQNDESVGVVWNQTGNPLSARGAISNVAMTPGAQSGCGGFVGLVADGTNSALDGDATPNCWWWAVGAALPHNHGGNLGIPAYSTPAPGLVSQRVRLYFKRPPTSICNTAGEGGTLSLTCPTGRTIGAITFASYGTPNGTCGGNDFTTGSCHAASSVSVMTTACVGQTSCNVTADNLTFTDPCSGTHKQLYVSATCQ